MRASSASTWVICGTESSGSGSSISCWACESVMVFVLRSDRTRPLGLPPLDDEKIALFNSMVAYSGTYTIQPDRVIHHVDMSWNETWSGTDQVRFCKIEGNILTFTSAPAKNPLGGSEVVHEVIFERASGLDG
jgi:Lipocalin-like domain